jgi:hypothetical protein
LWISAALGALATASPWKNNRKGIPPPITPRPIQPAHWRGVKARSSRQLAKNPSATSKPAATRLFLSVV